MNQELWKSIQNGCPWRIQVYSSLKNQDGENIWHECRATESPCQYDDCAIRHFIAIDQQNSNQGEAA